jgi:hypothetical protein
MSINDRYSREAPIIQGDQLENKIRENNTKLGHLTSEARSEMSMLEEKVDKFPQEIWRNSEHHTNTERVTTHGLKNWKSMINKLDKESSSCLRQSEKIVQYLNKNASNMANLKGRIETILKPTGTIARIKKFFGVKLIQSRHVKESDKYLSRVEGLKASGEKSIIATRNLLDSNVARRTAIYANLKLHFDVKSRFESTVKELRDETSTLLKGTGDSIKATLQVKKTLQDIDRLQTELEKSFAKAASKQVKFEDNGAQFIGDLQNEKNKLLHRIEKELKPLNKRLEFMIRVETAKEKAKSLQSTLKNLSKTNAEFRTPVVRKEFKAIMDKLNDGLVSLKKLGDQGMTSFQYKAAPSKEIVADQLREALVLGGIVSEKPRVGDEKASENQVQTEESSLVTQLQSVNDDLGVEGEKIATFQLAVELSQWVMKPGENENKIKPFLDIVRENGVSPTDLTPEKLIEHSRRAAAMEMPILQGNDAWVSIRDKELSNQNLEMCQAHEYLMKQLIDDIKDEGLNVESTEDLPIEGLSEEELNRVKKSNKERNAQRSYNKLIAEFLDTELTFIESVSNTQNAFRSLLGAGLITQSEFDALNFTGVDQLKSGFNVDCLKNSTLKEILLVNPNDLHQYFVALTKNSLSNPAMTETFSNIKERLKNQFKSEGILGFFDKSKSVKKILNEGRIPEFIQSPNNDEKLSKLIAYCEGGIIAPVQRSMRYKMLLSEMLDNIKKFNQESKLVPLLENAIKFFTYQAKQVNQAQKNNEEYIKAKAALK